MKATASLYKLLPPTIVATTAGGDMVPEIILSLSSAPHHGIWMLNWQEHHYAQKIPTLPVRGTVHSFTQGLEPKTGQMPIQLYMRRCNLSRWHATMLAHSLLQNLHRQKFPEAFQIA